ncbi:MAG TPA: oxygenase MpaB family protein [Microlunatus sp.]|nr:oxygenase MpaB family protein [Microlunatus sp.]
MTTVDDFDTIGPDAGTADPGLFGPDSVTWRIHGDPSMLVAGYRALLLQAVHPVVMAGFDDNSLFRGDPWGRLRRTGEWISTVTYGTSASAEQAGARLRRLHARLRPGVEPESGRSYRVDDPELLLWVHVTEVESFLSTYRRCGGDLRSGDADRYVDEMRVSARLVGLDPNRVPATQDEIADYYTAVRPELRLTRTARRNVAYGFFPPMPRWISLLTPAKPGWALLMSLAAAMLPPWTRRLYGLPGLPTTDLIATLNGRLLREVTSRIKITAQNPAYAAALARVR